MPFDPKGIPDDAWTALLGEWKPYSTPAKGRERYFRTMTPIDELTLDRKFDGQPGSLMAVLEGTTPVGEGWKAFLRRDEEGYLDIRVEVGELPRWKRFDLRCGVGWRSYSINLGGPVAKADLGELWVSVWDNDYQDRDRDRKDALMPEDENSLLREIGSRVLQSFTEDCVTDALRGDRYSIAHRLMRVDRLREDALAAEDRLETAKRDLSKAVFRLQSSQRRLKAKSAQDLSVVKEYFVDGPLGVLAMTASSTGDTVSIRPTDRRSKIPESSEIGRMTLGWDAKRVTVSKDGRMSHVSFTGCSAEAGRKALGQMVSRFVKDNPTCFLRAEIAVLATKVVKAQASADSADAELEEAILGLDEMRKRLGKTRKGVEGLPGHDRVTIPDLPVEGMTASEPRSLW